MMINFAWIVPPIFQNGFGFPENYRTWFYIGWVGNILSCIQIYAITQQKNLKGTDRQRRWLKRLVITSCLLPFARYIAFRLDLFDDQYAFEVAMGVVAVTSFLMALTAFLIALAIEGSSTPADQP